ncbi:MAG: flagellar hook-length control protein FliK [Chitinispirillaceae bacterium]|nr:flagellar hook-length control protein FliK [Chitinispirillaceae bacterium]
MINASLPGNYDGNAGKNIGKMDCINNGDTTGSCAGFSRSAMEGGNFAELYTRISNCNRDALVNDDEELEMEKAQDDQSNTEVISVVDPVSFLPLQDLTVSEDIAYVENSTVASELISSALHTVTEVLGLPDRGVEKSGILKVNDSTVGELAEVVYTLTEIIAALEIPGNNVTSSQLSVENTADTGTGTEATLQNTGSADISTILRVELFKLKMGIQLLGASAEVQNKAAELAQKVSMAGMNQAIDPSSISMPLEQIKKLFGRVLDSMNKDASKAGNADVKLNHFPDSITIDSLEKDNDIVKKFDTQTYRTLLKVDAVESNGEETGEKGSIDRLHKNEDLITVVNTEAAVSLDGIEDTSMPELAVASDVKSIKMDVSTSHFITQEKISSALHRMDDEAPVMEQITGKLTSVIRSGSNEVRIQLRPESLGEVSLRIKMEGDVVFAKIQVESQQVRQIVESNLQLLKDSLAGQNLSAGLIDVSVGNDDNSGGNFEWNLQHNHDDRKYSGGDGERQAERVQDDASVNISKVTGNDTGIRYGNNSIEYYA